MPAPLAFERLRLAGFKSFADATELRIDPGLTGVVGPNGCGKSNLLEALRWVMGEGSPRGMRAEGMDDVIFGGAAGRPARTLAEVTLTLRQGEEPVEISRRIARGEGSVYRRNGREVRLRDIQLLLADSATGAHAAALVGQGRVAAIIAAKPVERRLMLEEAAGIAGLAVRRREAEIRLKAAATNLERAQDVATGLEAQAASLRRQARAAQRYAALSAAIRLTEAQLLFAQWSEAQDRAALAVRAAEEAALAARAAGEAATALEKQRADLARAAGPLADALAEARAERDRAAAELLRLGSELDRIAARGAELRGRIAAAERERERETALAAEAERSWRALADELAALEAGADARSRAVTEAAARLETAQAAAETAESALAAALDARGALRARAQAAAEQTRRAMQALERARAAEAQAEARLRAAGDGGGAAAVAQAQAAQEATEAALAQADTEREAAEAARQSAESARAEAAPAAAAARTNLAALESERAALAAQSRPSAGAMARVRAAPGFEAALAAALGEDLAAPVGEAGAGWARLAGCDGDPPLPAGCLRLADHAQAPAELARRLAQVGVVEGWEAGAALAPQLLPGQRLVSRDGALWRWDGFEARQPAGLRAAEALRAANRLAELEAALPQARTAAEAAAALLAHAETEAAQAQAAARAAAEARARAAAQAQAAARTLAEARARAEGQARRQAAALEELARLRAERAAAQTALAAAGADAPDPQALASAEAGASRAQSEAQAAREAQRAAQEATHAAAQAVARAEERTTALQRDLAQWRDRAAAASARLGEVAPTIAALAAELAALAGAPDELEALRHRRERERAALDERLSELTRQRDAQATGLAALETELGQAREAMTQARERHASAQADARHAAERGAELAARCAERFGCAPSALPQAAGFEPEPGDAGALQADLARLAGERERLGAVNLRAGQELAEAEAELERIAAERAEIDTAIHRLRGQIGALNREGRERLRATFAAVDAQFRALFVRLFGGGEARLTLIDAEDPLDAGLEILARPPGKAMQSLSLLSGGEQALTATALIFALFLINPAPICVLDEVDAPLDDANVERFCDLLREVADTTPTRFLIVTHNPLTMARLDRLYGVTMTEPGVSRLVSVDLAEAERLAALEL